MDYREDKKENKQMMKVCSLASSSKGNCTIVYNDDEILLVDMGITLKDLEEKLNILKLDINKIIGVVLSHEHSDHTKGIKALHKKYLVPVYCHFDAFEGVLRKTGISGGAVIRFSYNPFAVGSFMVESFRVSHDVPCVGFNIFENGNKVSIVTDLGYTTNDIVSKLYDSRMVILEANHDEQMVIDGSYPPVLKARILGKQGHLSNINSAKVVVDIAQHGVRQVLFAHLSEENNTPELCYKTICDYCVSKGVTPNVNILLDIAKPQGLGPIFIIK